MELGFLTAEKCILCTDLTAISWRNLRAVACVDAHIFRGEIASPYAGDSAANVQIQYNWYIFRQHFAMGDAFIKGMFATLAAYADAR